MTTSDDATEASSAGDHVDRVEASAGVGAGTYRAVRAGSPDLVATGLGSESEIIIEVGEECTIDGRPTHEAEIQGTLDRLTALGYLPSPEEVVQANYAEDVRIFPSRHERPVEGAGLREFRVLAPNQEHYGGSIRVRRADPVPPPRGRWEFVPALSALDGGRLQLGLPVPPAVKFNPYLSKPKWIYQAWRECFDAKNTSCCPRAILARVISTLRTSRRILTASSINALPHNTIR